MAVPKLIQDLKGPWQGTSKLHCPWPPEAEPIRSCDSTLVCEFDPNGTHAKISLSWVEGGPQYSEFLICGSPEKDEVTCGWTDSWHMSAAVMHLRGIGMEGNLVNLLGSYSVEGHPDWGWRITLSTSASGSLELAMFNISPEGEEEWAVRAEYRRA